MPLPTKTIYDPVEVDEDYFAQNPDAWGEFYAKLKTYPQGVVDVLFGNDTADIVERICLSSRLNSEQAASLSKLIRAVLVADVFIGDMPLEISKRLGVNQNTGREIANQIVSLLFADSIEDIKKMQAAKFPDRVAQKQVPPAPGADLPETGGNIIDLRNQR